MKDFIARVQNDLNKLQKTIEKEGDQLVKKMRAAATKAANNKNLSAKAREIEQLVENQMKKLEPAVVKIVKNIKTNAEKYGIDLKDLEKKVEKAANAAKSTIRKARGKTTAAKKSAPKRKRPAAKKAAPKAAPAPAADNTPEE